MATNNLSVRKGKCINFGNCKVADSKEVVEVNLGDEFICPNPECGGMLVEEKKPPKGKFIFVGIAAFALLLIIGGIFAYINFQKNKVNNVIEIAEKVVGESNIDTAKNALNEAVAKLLGEADLFFTNKDYDKAKQAYNAILALDPNNQKAKQSLSEIDRISLPPQIDKKEDKGEEVTNPSPGRISKTLKFEYGTYKGDILNGLRDGQGVMTYTERYLISPKDLKKRYAEAGEYVSGTWVKGNIVNGKLFDKNGEQKETLIIGH